MAPDLRIEPATQDDVPLILNLVKKLAAYERLSHEVVATEEDFTAALFGATPVAEALLAFSGNQPVGFALYFSTFSTFVGLESIWRIFSSSLNTAARESARLSSPASRRSHAIVTVAVWNGRC
jgi:hypothetical protein